MKRTNILIAFLCISITVLTGMLVMTSSGTEQPIHLPGTELTEPVDDVAQLYEELQLAGKVDYEAFRQGVEGYKNIDGRNKNILALIDFNLPSTEERLYIFDLDKKETLFTTHVSHGRNSGDNYATSFSNVNGSYQSSLGFYLTEKTYNGKNGYSLVLEGLEKDINHRAKERAIVMHGAPYSNPSIIASNGRLGRSLGCPAVPEALARPIIDTLKEGAVLYIHANS